MMRMDCQVPVVSQADRYSSILRKFRYNFEELTDSSELTKKCVFGVFGVFDVFDVFRCIRATFCSIPLCTLFIFVQVPLVKVVAEFPRPLGIGLSAHFDLTPHCDLEGRSVVSLTTQSD